MSTLALVTTPTSFAQLGNGSRKRMPMSAVTMMLSTGTRCRIEVFSNASGM